MSNDKSADALPNWQVLEIWRRANGTLPGSSMLSRMVVDFAREFARELLAASSVEQHEAAPAERERGDAICQESDGCPTEKAVLQRFWRAHQGKLPAPSAPLGDAGNGANERAAFEALLAKVPRKPNAITYEKGWGLLDELQRLAESRAPRTEVAGAVAAGQEVAQYQYRAVTPTHKGEWHNCNAEKARLIKEQTQLSIFEVRALCEIPQPSFADAAASQPDKE